jgi:hypothetical protein
MPEALGSLYGGNRWAAGISANSVKLGAGDFRNWQILLQKPVETDREA